MLSRLALPAALALMLVSLLPAGAQKPADPYAGHVAPTGPRAPDDERRAFELPPGFEAQLVAADPDIHKPLNLAFDAKGRLWLTETVEYPFPAKPGQGRDRVLVLDDFGPDGRARRISTFADGLNIPIGLLPTADGCLVYTIPHILKLTDTDGDGRADRREVLYEKYGFQDTHGMTSAFTPGFDGWVYACHGFANTSAVKPTRAGDAAPVTMQSGNTYRIKADGSRLEQYTWGQVNPFGLCFDPWGRLYSADCHSQPIYQLLRGAYYPSFGKPHDGLGFGPETITNYHGSTAISGIVYYAADQFPAAHQGTAYIGDVVTNRINQFRLTWHGSSPRAQQQEFLVSADPWFRPVDLKLGPDGALYVADFYNRIIGHYEVPLDHPGRDRQRGRVWRIVYRGPDGQSPQPSPPRDRTRSSIPELVADLASPNLTVRIQAADLLVSRGGDEGRRLLTALPASANPWQKAHALWVLHRTNALDDAALGKALDDNDAPVRAHALGILAERPSLPANLRGAVTARLHDADAQVRRAAASALGRHPDASSLRPLLALLHAAPADDTHLIHVARMALRDTLRAPGAWDAVSRGPWDARDSRDLAAAALGLPTPEAARYLLDTLRAAPQTSGRLPDIVHHVARHGAADARSSLIVWLRARPDVEPQGQAALLRSIHQGLQERGARLAGEPRRWAADLAARLVSSSRDSDVRTGIELIAALGLEDQQPAVWRIARDPAAPESRRLAALQAAAALKPQPLISALGTLLQDASQPQSLREAAGKVLASLNQPEPLAHLALALPAAPAALQSSLAQGLAASPAGVEKLLQTVEAGKASPRLLREPAVEVRLRQADLPDLPQRLEKLTRGVPPADQRVGQMIAARLKAFQSAHPDPAQGFKVFEKHCALCHQVQGKGARIGPQLDGIGLRGFDRLAEDVLDPNRNVDQAFRLTTLHLKSGQSVAGLLLREEGAVYVLADAQGKEVRVPRTTVEERETSQLSPMPAGLADQIPEADFLHLMAYLLSQARPAEKPSPEPGRP